MQASFFSYLTCFSQIAGHIADILSFAALIHQTAPCVYQQFFAQPKLII